MDYWQQLLKSLSGAGGQPTASPQPGQQTAGRFGGDMYQPGYGPDFGEGNQFNPPVSPPNYESYAPNPNTPGISNRYDDSYGQLLESLRGGMGGQDMLSNLLDKFRGNIGDLKSFMESPAYRGALAFSAKNSDAYKGLASLQDPTKQALSQGLGQISAAGGRGVSQAIAQLNTLGLGRNVGLAGAVRQSGELDTAQRSAGFKNALEQQAYQNERSRLDQLLNMEQSMQQLALGFSPQPRQPGNGPSTGDWIALAGTLVGSAFGSPWLGAALGGASKATTK